jgi:hypothetical protein
MAQKTLAERIEDQHGMSLMLMRAQSILTDMNAPAHMVKRITDRFIDSEDKWMALVEEELAEEGIIV